MHSLNPTPGGHRGDSKATEYCCDLVSVAACTLGLSSVSPALVCTPLCVLQEVTHYLVKWCSLPYEESTWELEEDVDPGKIKEFEALQIPPEIKHMVTYPEVTYPAGSSVPWAGRDSLCFLKAQQW